ncbi:hypothetical protein [Sabulibacter ruber]|uniref:hypothetical protein n=1 Tax=Sabulibacter ruber TaxID=2811901 RepID=UPI001A95DA90|nr:hypothetical protein [Sabulibacter ruber]
MKIVYSAVIALGMMVPVEVAFAQTLATPPAAVKPASSSATSKQQETKKQQDAKLGAKINALIKKQPSSTPATTAAKQSSTATPSSPKTAAPTQAAAQDSAPKTPPRPLSRVDRLIIEREQLVLKYDYLKAQENNFWGKASKEDMIAVIDALKDILRKDEEIIHAVERENLETRRNVARRAAQLEAEAKKLNNQVQGDKRVITDNIYDLKSSVTNAQNLLKRKDRQIKDLEEKLQDSKDQKFEHDAIAAFFAMLCVLLAGYIVRLRNKLTSQAENQVKA